MKTVSNDLLEEMTRRLVEQFQPEQVILFGSHRIGSRKRRMTWLRRVFLPPVASRCWTQPFITANKLRRKPSRDFWSSATKSSRESTMWKF